MADSETAVWADLRSAMPSAVQWACLDHAAVAPLSDPAYRALTAWGTDLVQNGAANWPRWAARLEEIRRCAARLIGADPLEMALVRSTTEGINLVAEGFPWRDGDNVVTLSDEFPSNLYPWMHLANRGVETRRVAPLACQDPLDALAQACDDRTRIVSVSWVGYVSGWRQELDELTQMAHDRGALLFLDAIQGLGVFPLDVRRTPIDFLAADGHKWLLGPEGAGLFYLKQDHLDLLRPVGVGWNSVRQSSDFSRIELSFKPSAGRYEGGTYNMGGFMALGASLDLLGRYPVAEVARRVLATTDELCERLSSLGANIVSSRERAHASGIVSFDLPGRDPQQLRNQCRQRQVLLSCRGGHLRASPHAYNNSHDLDCLAHALQSPS